MSHGVEPDQLDDFVSRSLCTMSLVSWIIENHRYSLHDKLLTKERRHRKL